RLLKVALGSGEVESLMRGDTGAPITIPGYVWGASDNLYMVSGTAVYALTTTAMPSSLSFGIPDRAVTVNVTSAAQNAAGGVTAGSGAIQPDSRSGSSFGLAIISYWENGIVTSETAVPATAPIQTGRLYASLAGSVNTGLAITNPNDQPAVIQSHFTDTTGN